MTCPKLLVRVVKMSNSVSFFLPIPIFLCGLVLVSIYLSIYLGGRVPVSAGLDPPAGQEEGRGGAAVRRPAHGKDRLA